MRYGDLKDWIEMESWFPKSTTYTYKGQWVDTDKYDIVPKSSYKKELIEKKEVRISELKEQIKELESAIKELNT